MQDIKTCKINKRKKDTQKYMFLRCYLGLPEFVPNLAYMKKIKSKILSSPSGREGEGGRTEGKVPNKFTKLP